MQERLDSVIHARQHKEETAQGQQQQEDTRDYTDYDHLGGGVFKATAEQQQLYKAFVADVKAHAQGVSSSSSYGQQPGVVEMQVLKPTAAPLTAAAGAGGSTGARAVAAAAGAISSAGNVMGDRLVSAGRAAAALGRTTGSDSTRTGRVAGANPKAGAAGSAGSIQGGAAAVELPAGAVRQAAMGPLADATIAAVKKPLSVEQQRRLRRRQQLAAAAAKRGKGNGRDPDLLDKLY
jgi:hypothetical protein